MNQHSEEQKFYSLNNSPEVENLEGGLNLSQTKNIILRRLPLITGFTVFMTCLAFFKVLLTPPVYTASFELLEPLNIETKVTSTNEESRETREEITSVDFNDIQLKILKSPRLISRTVESLKGKYAKANYQEIANNLTINIISDSQESKNSQNILQVQYENPDKEKVSMVIEALTNTYIEYSAEKRLLGVKRGIAFLDRQIIIAREEVKDIEEQIKTLRNKNNFIKPDLSLEPLALRSKNLTQEDEQIKSRLPELKFMAQKLEQELKTQPAESDVAVKFATPQYLELLNQLRETDVKIARKSAVFSSNSIEIQTLEQEKQQVISLLAKAGEEILKQLNSEIKALESRQKSIAIETANLKWQLSSWSTVSSDYNNLLQRLNRANNKLNEFTVQKDALSIEAAQQEAPWQLLTPAAEPQTKNIGVLNFTLLGFTLGLLVGTGIALILDKHENVIYTSTEVEKITNLPVLGTIPYTPNKTLSLIEQTNYKPGLRQLPQQKSLLKRQQQSISDPASFSIEAFRSFAANLGLLNFNINSLNSDIKIQSLVITSAIPGEGKSIVALNLARACASMGKKTLIVDTDLRSNDHLTKYLGLESEIGLSNILSQDNFNLSSDHINIKQLPLENNLFIITSGFKSEFTQLFSESDPIKQDPSRLLASAKMHLLMKKLETNFDIIIYDLCAILGFADVNLLAGHTDGIVIVTGVGKIHAVELNEALNQLKLCKAPILGLAINNVVNN